MERTRWIVGALAGMVMALVATSPASAHQPSLDRVTIVGDAVVGSPLRAVIAGTVDPSAVEYRWCHQRAGAGDKCAPGRPIGTSQVYVPVADDVGKSLLVKASVKVAEFTLEATSAATAPVGVAAAPTLPPPPIVAPPPPIVSPPRIITPPLSPQPGSAPARLRYMRPFPVVRMRGVVAARGSHVDLLTVTAPRTATVLVRCAGHGCPIGRATRRPGHIRAFERYLPAGLRITLRVTRPSRIGKYVRLIIRAGKPPARRDRCVLPGSRRAVRCPHV